MIRLLTFSALAALLAGNARALAPAAPDDYPMRAEKVAEGVYAVITPARDFPNPQNKGWNSNSAFAVTGEGVLVVDTGSSQTIGAALRETIRGVTEQPVRWIVNTHSHGDHWLGNRALAGPDTRIFASPEVTKRIQGEGQRWIDLFNDMTAGATGTDSHVLAPTHPIAERTRLNLGGLAVELIPSGDSHSPGDLVVWLPDRKVLVAGDVVYSDRAPSTFDAKVKRWIGFLGELEALQPQVVVPGHGAVADVGAIARLRTYFERLWGLVAQGYEAGQADFEIAPTVREQMAEFEPHYPGLDDKVGASVSHVYLQVEAEAF